MFVHCCTNYIASYLRSQCLCLQAVALSIYSASPLSRVAFVLSSHPCLLIPFILDGLYIPNAASPGGNADPLITSLKISKYYIIVKFEWIVSKLSYRVANTRVKEMSFLHMEKN